MTVRAARALRALLLTVAVVLSVLAHHELMPGTDAASASDMQAMPAAVVAAHHGASMAPTAVPEAAASQAMSCGGVAMCTAAGVAHPPAPAAPPTSASLDAPARARPHVHPLPPGTGPPEPGDSTSVLRI